MSIETTTTGSAVIEITVHPMDYELLTQAAAVTHTEIEDFASLAVYRQSRQTLADMGRQS